MQITIRLGKRITDDVTIKISDITDAVEIYNAVFKKTGSNGLAAVAVEKVNSGEYVVEKGDEE